MVSLPPRLWPRCCSPSKVPLSPIHAARPCGPASRAWTWKTNRPAAPRLIGAAVVIVVVSFAVSSRIFDLSFRRRGLPSSLQVRQLAAGWNPIWDSKLAESLGGEWHVESLPKAAWLLEAMVFRATGSLESAKGVQIIALAAAFLLAWAALEKYGIRRRAAVYGRAAPRGGQPHRADATLFILHRRIRTFLVAYIILLAIAALLVEGTRAALAGGPRDKRRIAR